MDADRALRLEKSEHRETKLKLLKSAPTSVTPNVQPCPSAISLSCLQMIVRACLW